MKAASDDPVPGAARPKFRARCARSRVVAFKRDPKSRGRDVHAEMLDGVGLRSECQAADSRLNAIGPVRVSVYASLLSTDARSHP
jgi:hypothetical protein